MPSEGLYLNRFSPGKHFCQCNLGGERIVFEIISIRKAFVFYSAIRICLCNDPCHTSASNLGDNKKTYDFVICKHPENYWESLHCISQNGFLDGTYKPSKDCESITRYAAYKKVSWATPMYDNTLINHKLAHRSTQPLYTIKHKLKAQQTQNQFHLSFIRTEFSVRLQVSSDRVTAIVKNMCTYLMVSRYTYIPEFRYSPLSLIYLWLVLILILCLDKGSWKSPMILSHLVTMLNLIWWGLFHPTNRQY